MAHVTVYLSDKVEQKAREAARAAKTSMSKWVANQVERAVETDLPPEFLALAGAFPDFPDAEELRAGYGQDVPRESLD
jgi:hypothetical protein